VWQPARGTAETWTAGECRVPSGWTVARICAVEPGSVP
jgi:hypothetical protein